EARSALAGHSPRAESDLLDWCMSQSSIDLQTTLALLVAETIDLRHEGIGVADRRLQAIGDKIATALDLDMTRFWRADLAFWSCLPKATLLDTLANSPALVALDDRERTTLLKAHAKLKKDALAIAVDQTLEGTAWLPEPLITPVETPLYEVTDAGVEALEAA